jgi:hypothetical protein
MIVRTNDEALILPFKKKASETFSDGDLVTTDVSGYLTKAVAGTTKAKLLGSIVGDVLATDADYAQNTDKLVDVFTSCYEDVFIADVGTGSMTQALVNTYCDLKDKSSIDVTASAIGCVKLLRFISATKAKVAMCV